MDPDDPNALLDAVVNKLLLDVREVAALLGCGKTYVYELLARGELPWVKLGRLTRIPRSSLEAFVSRKVSETSFE
jgi:excisionase family DNA binding protein